MRRAALALWLAGCLPAMAGAAEITAARYADPTREYPHGVLGDDEEWKTLEIEVRSERGTEGSLFQGHLTRTWRIEAPADMVFEDTAPRLWDITGDGAPEVVVVASHQRLGGQLIIVGLEGGTLEYLATTPPIGTRFRWLAPVGAADFDGDGHIEVAYVDRPHLAKTLRLWRYADGTFREVAARPGLTNHTIGDAAIRGGLRDCGAGPEMILADGTWSRATAVTWDGRAFALSDLGALGSVAALDGYLSCN